MLASDPPEHTRQRRVVTTLWAPGRVRELRPYLARVVDDLTAGWRPGTPVDLVADLAVPLPVTVVSELLGVPESDRAVLAARSHELFEATGTDRVDSASHRIGDYLTRLVDTAGDGRETARSAPCCATARGALDRPS
ncbi:hypothetical protein ACFVJ8_01675 [Streptomyces yangpuensis]|uniref:hypothetical protein n=1 Tax=Streptomyces yangpuensis TaxID=1648182 RepID=UPI0036449417